MKSKPVSSNRNQSIQEEITRWEMVITNANLIISQAQDALKKLHIENNGTFSPEGPNEFAMRALAKRQERMNKSMKRGNSK